MIVLSLSRGIQSELLLRWYTYEWHYKSRSAGAYISFHFLEKMLRAAGLPASRHVRLSNVRQMSLNSKGLGITPAFATFLASKKSLKSSNNVGKGLHHDADLGDSSLCRRRHLTSNNDIKKRFINLWTTTASLRAPAELYQSWKGHTAVWRCLPLCELLLLPTCQHEMTTCIEQRVCNGSTLFLRYKQCGNHFYIPKNFVIGDKTTLSQLQQIISTKNKWMRSRKFHIALQATCRATLDCHTRYQRIVLILPRKNRVERNLKPGNTVESFRPTATLVRNVRKMRGRAFEMLSVARWAHFEPRRARLIDNLGIFMIYHYPEIDHIILEDVL